MPYPIRGRCFSSPISLKDFKGWVHSNGLLDHFRTRMVEKSYGVSYQRKTHSLNLQAIRHAKRGECSIENCAELRFVTATYLELDNFVEELPVTLGTTTQIRSDCSL